MILGSFDRPMLPPWSVQSFSHRLMCWEDKEQTGRKLLLLLLSSSSSSMKMMMLMMMTMMIVVLVVMVVATESPNALQNATFRTCFSHVCVINSFPADWTLLSAIRSLRICMRHKPEGRGFNPHGLIGSLY